MSIVPRVHPWFRRPLSPGGTLVLVSILVLAPAWQFRDVLATYRLFSDDFAYVAASRTMGRTLRNLFVPHNTHIVPFWRLLTWALVSIAGRLENLQPVLAGAAYGILAAVMLMMGRLVASETGRAVIGLAAMVAVGSTAVMEPSGTWYSASQTLWAGFGILAMLWYLQGWQRSGGRWRLIAACVMAWLAAGSWTIGHTAGPVGSVYLWTDGRSKCRRIAWVPLAATLIAVAIAMSLGGKRINATISFGGRTTLQASDPVQGIRHTFQAIPENLFFGNLGLLSETTVSQGIVLTLGLVVAWVASWRRKGRPNPLECAGASLVVVSFFVEWSFRGYLPFSSLRGIVPWYDTIPDIGLVLFGAGWAHRQWPPSAVATGPARSGFVPTRAEGIAVLVFQAALLTLNQPRVDALYHSTLPGMTAEERKAFPIPSLKHMRYVYVGGQRSLWQERTLKRLDQAEEVARRLGMTRQEIASVIGRIDAPDLPRVYNAADMLALPDGDTESSPAPARAAEIRAALAPWIALEPDPFSPELLFKALGIHVELTDEERRALETVPRRD
jgi:hypothetical protein